MSTPATTQPRHGLGMEVASGLLSLLALVATIALWPRQTTAGLEDTPATVDKAGIALAVTAGGVLLVAAAVLFVGGRLVHWVARRAARD